MGAEGLDFLMGWVIHICANDEYWSQVGAKNRPENIIIRYLSLVYLYVFEFEGSQRFQFSFTDFSLVYCSAFAQIFPRSQPMRESNTFTKGWRDWFGIRLYVIRTYYTPLDGWVLENQQKLTPGQAPHLNHTLGHSARQS
jgi:hypothetical protein